MMGYSQADLARFHHWTVLLNALESELAATEKKLENPDANSAPEKDSSEWSNLTTDLELLGRIPKVLEARARAIAARQNQMIARCRHKLESIQDQLELEHQLSLSTEPEPVYVDVTG